MHHRQLVIFTLIFIYICFLGSSYLFSDDTSSKPQDMHTSQRIIDRQLSKPDETVFKQTRVEDPTKE